MNYCVKYVELNRLVFQNKACFKKQANYVWQKVLEHMDYKITVSLRNNYFSTGKVQSAIPRGAA